MSTSPEPAVRLVFRAFNVDRVVVLRDPTARGFQDAAAGSRRDTGDPAAAAAVVAAGTRRDTAGPSSAAAAGAGAGEVGLLS